MLFAYVVLLDDLLEARVVQLRELGQVVHVCDDVAQVLLEQVEVLLDRLAVLAQAILLHTPDRLGDLLLRRCYAPNDLLGLDALEGVDLVELLLELLHKVGLGLVIPDVRRAQLALEALVVDVVEDPLAVEGRLQLLAEPASAH